MRLPAFIAKAVFPIVAERTARKREMQLSADERAAAAALRTGGMYELDIRIVANALAKIRGYGAAEAMARTRAGLMLAFADGSISTNPTRPEIIAAAWRGELAAEKSS